MKKNGNKNKSKNRSIGLVYNGFGYELESLHI